MDIVCENRWNIQSKVHSYLLWYLENWTDRDRDTEKEEVLIINSNK